MVHATRKFLLGITFLGLFIGMALISTGFAGHSWWKKEVGDIFKTEDGLWRFCSKTGSDTICFNRKNVFEFEDSKDIVLLLLCFAGFFGLVAAITVLCLCCCSSNSGCWMCGGVTVVFLSFVAAGTGLAAMIYAEVEFKDNWDNMDHGWSAITAWIGAVMFFLLFVLSIVLTCLSPASRQPAAPKQEGPFYNQGMQMHGDLGYQRN